MESFLYFFSKNDTSVCGGGGGGGGGTRISGERVVIRVVSTKGGFVPSQWSISPRERLFVFVFSRVVGASSEEAEEDAEAEAEEDKDIVVDVSSACESVRSAITTLK